MGLIWKKNESLLRIDKNLLVLLRDWEMKKFLNLSRGKQIMTKEETLF